MDRAYWNTNHYYSQIYQEYGQRASQPEAGQTSAGLPASGASGSHPAPGQPQPYLNPNLQAQIPSSPGLGWEYLQCPSQPQAGQTFAELLTSGASWSYPSPGQPQPYLNPNLQVQIPPSPDWEYLLSPQSIAVEDPIHNEVLSEPANPQPPVEAWRRRHPVKERFLAGLEAFGRGAPLADCSSSLLFRNYIKSNGEMVGKGIPLYKQLTPEEKTRLDQAIIARQGAKLIRLADENTVAERFLAGLEAFERGAPLKDCSSSLLFRNYIKSNGELVSRGISLYKQLTPVEKMRLDQAIIARQEAKRKRLTDDETVEKRFPAGLDRDTQGAKLKECSASQSFKSYASDNSRLNEPGEALHVGPLHVGLSPEEQARGDQALLSRKRNYRERSMTAERFLAGLKNYAQGVKLKECSATLKFTSYVSDDGRLHEMGREVRAGLPPEDQERVDQALLSRSDIYWARMMVNTTVEERFLEGLAKYAQGGKLKECSATLPFKSYVSDEGHLQKSGRNLRATLSPADQARVDQALRSRNEIYRERLSLTIKRFLASLDNYERGVLLSKCAKDIRLCRYVTNDGHLQAEQGQPLYNKLSRDDKARVDQALTARRRMASQSLVGDVGKFMATLEPYGNGQALLKCGKQSGLNGKVTTYLTPEGGLTSKGKLLIEKLQPGQRNEVFNAIAKRQKRQQCPELNPQVPESPWQRSEMPSPMPETGGMDPTAMADPMQTEAMWASVWQLTGQAAPGPSDPIPYYDSEAVEADFQRQYGPTD
ncbi:MAG: hypothetical protein P8X89_13995 [Reinekea sp.]